MSEESQKQQQNTVLQDDRARTQKYRALGLLGLALLFEFGSLFLMGPVAIGIFAVGVVLCVVGSFFLALVQKHGWAGVTFATVLALVPFLGPFFLCADATSRRGFLLAALFIIGILAAIAIPNFMTYGARARQSEAKVNLGGIFTTATAFKEKNKTFVISDIKQLGFMPAGTQRYSLWYAVNGVPTMIPSGNLTQGPCDITTPPTTVRVAASATGFTAAAKGNMDGDATCDEWSINDARQLINTLNDVNR